MADFTAADVKLLREMTGAGMMDCKKALEEANGDFDAAIDILRTKGAAKAAKRGAEREASAGLVAHAPGVLVELKCETDFVAKGEDFVVAAQRKRASDLPPAVGVLVEYDGNADAARGAAMQIAAMRPQYLTRDEVPADVVAKEREIAEATSREEGKPEQAIAKITEGRLNGFFKDVVLLEQPSVTENKKTVKAVLDESGTSLKQFARFEVGA